VAEYRYSSGDLMGSPHSYFYTTFEGHGFLAAWWRARHVALDALPAPAHAAPDVVVDVTGTEAFLEQAVREAMEGGPPGTALPQHAEALLRKYEVGKRIYDAYDDELRPASREHFRTVAYYVRAGEAFDLIYRNFADIRGLNVLLKSVDTLCAHAAELDPALGARVSRLILNERGHVQRLCSRLGVDSP